MKESETREAVERAAARARAQAQADGRGDISQDAMRRKMEQYAERDRREGKI